MRWSGEILSKKFCLTDIHLLFSPPQIIFVEKKASAMIKMSRTLSRYIPQRRGLPSVNNIKVQKTAAVILGDQKDNFTFVNHNLCPFR